MNSMTTNYSFRMAERQPFHIIFDGQMQVQINKSFVVHSFPSSFSFLLAPFSSVSEWCDLAHIRNFSGCLWNISSVLERHKTKQMIQTEEKGGKIKSTKEIKWKKKCLRSLFCIFTFSGNKARHKKYKYSKWCNQNSVENDNKHWECRRHFANEQKQLCGQARSKCTEKSEPTKIFSIWICKMEYDSMVNCELFFRYLNAKHISQTNEN